jgi:hypothetical protein
MKAAVFPGSSGHLREMGFGLIEVRSSAQQRELAGVVDLISTSPDNLYAWAVEGGPRMRVVAGGQVPGLALYEGPTDGPLAVDAVDSGFAFLARALDGDKRTPVAVGATPARAEALRVGRAGAALLHPPFVDGLRLAARISDAFDAYQGMVIATRHARLEAAAEIAEVFGPVSDEGLKTVWELRRRYAPDACPADWKLEMVSV